MAAPSKFAPEIRGALLERFSAGLSLPDAASAAGVNEKTLKSWLARGRREDEGEYADFAEAADAAREEARNRPEPMTDDEHRLAVSQAARKGNVQALKLYWEMLLADRASESDDEEPADPLSAVDELAAKRAART